MPAPKQYAKQTWQDNNSLYPISAARMSAIESELFRGSLRDDGIVSFDEYTGTDDQRWVAAWNDLRASTRKYTLQLPARTFSVSTSIPLFSGAAMIGPTSPGGAQNLEIGGGNLVAHRLVWQGGSGASSTFTCSGTINDLNFSGFAWQSGGSGQFIHSNSGSNVYPARFDNLTIYGGNGGFGSRTQGKFIGTQCYFTGHWTVLGYTDTPFRIGGSDMRFNWYLNSNSPNGVSGGGKPIVWLDSLQKTENGYMYLTAERDWTALQVSGSRAHDVSLSRCIIEGRGSGSYPQATYPLIDMQGGVLIVNEARFAHMSDDNTTQAPGWIRIAGDSVIRLNTAVIENDAGTANTFPFLYVANGHTGAYNVDWPIATNASSVYVRKSDGSTVSIPLDNRINGSAV